MSTKASMAQESTLELMVFKGGDDETALLVNPSPFCTKLELFLKVAGIDYVKPELAPGDMGPTGKLPNVKIGGERLADSAVIIDRLETTGGSSLDDVLSEEEKAQGRFMVAASRSSKSLDAKDPKTTSDKHQAKAHRRRDQATMSTKASMAQESPLELMVFNTSDDETALLVNPSPFCTKLELFLKVVGIDYVKPELAPGDMGPTGKLPNVKIGDERVADSAVIINRLEATRGSSLDDVLSEEDKAQGRFIISACEDKLYFCMVYLSWIHNANWPTTRAVYFSEVPWGLRKLISGKARKGIKKALHGQGMGRRPVDEIIAIGKEVVDDLAVVLGDKTAFFGTPESTVADIAVYAQLNHLLYANLPYNPIGDHVKTKPNLVAFVDRITKRYFPNIYENRAKEVTKTAA
eukprot:CAMPEP_0197430812 /NCGR_PEP_ID=MMETSP1170-20131217/52848_1 /TAXON_ID=54406 /ORGANISM="Sarcinochrysis sp, Strain CCMP770" /LENGTH=406 /DNA_ID=CAMNT_0042958739 /DNA_START=65 /DNA_END=1285 /DNA_ORIENTATION=-